MKSADGPAGARRAAALVGIACCAETATSTMSEDAAKVDITFSFRDAFTNALITVHAQVKSGRSYLKGRTHNKLKLGIDKATINALNNGGTPGLLLWVPPKPQRDIFWYYTDPRAPLPPYVAVPLENSIRPSIRYDLTRAHAYGTWQRKSPQQTVATPASIDIRSIRHKYAELSQKIWPHPLVGNLRLSRYAWRHITRRSKTKAARDLALTISRHLGPFLTTKPDRYYRADSKIAVNGRQTTETRHILCWYRNALRIGNRNYTLVLRVREIIKYPTDWQHLPLAHDEIKQEAILASWWCK